MSPDPGNAGADIANPQTWNGYAYVGNNPLLYADPAGLGFFSDLWSVFETAVGLYSADGVQLSNTEPWNEMPPINSIPAAGPVNTGGVFGEGNTGPFVFNEQPTTQPQLDSQLDRDIWTARIVAGLSVLLGPVPYVVGTHTFLYQKMKTGGQWDFKNQPTRLAHPELDDYGNCHYGAVGHAMGLPDLYMRWAGEAYSYYSFRRLGKYPPKNFGRPWSGPPWGDNPENQSQIERGQTTGRCTP